MGNFLAVGATLAMFEQPSVVLRLKCLRGTDATDP